MSGTPVHKKMESKEGLRQLEEPQGILRKLKLSSGKGAAGLLQMAPQLHAADADWAYRLFPACAPESVRICMAA